MKRVDQRKFLTVMLVFAVVLMGVFFPSHMKVHAEDLDTIPFVTVEQLKEFNTDDTDGSVNALKVRFGNNNHEWWIAGTQNNNLVLFAATPLATNQQFEPKTSQKDYSADWNCYYPNGEPTVVYSNHYGASLLRKTLNDLETSYFTSSEQDLMNNTTIYTNDIKNSSVYSTTDKLYLAYGDFVDKWHITVGTNSVDDLNNGLRIDDKYWGQKSNPYFARTPSSNAPPGSTGTYVMIVQPAAHVGNANSITSKRALVPAFELNISSVLFAASIPAVMSEGQLDLSDAMTLRYNTDTLGLAQISFNKKLVKLKNVPANTYLVVQDSKGAYTKQITNETSVTADSMGLDSFNDCKVWLETTNDRITYATLATQAPGCDVKVEIGQNMTVTTGNEIQTEVAGEISKIIISTNSRYYFPEDYISHISSDLKGLQVERVNNGTITITGTPIDDVHITLPDPMIIPDIEILNVAPVILAKDKVVIVGEDFKPLEGVTATDFEDGDITKNIEIIKNEVNTTKVGVYEVTYKVIDSQGASTTKTITVVVKEKEVPSIDEDETTPNTETNKKPSSSIKTSDTTSMVVWVMLIAISGGLLIVMNKKKRMFDK